MEFLNRSSHYGLLRLNKSSKMEYSTEDGRWRDISCHGDAPGCLCNASLTAIGSRIYLFGGLNNDMGWNNDMWCFNSGNYILWFNTTFLVLYEFFPFPAENDLKT